MKDNKLPYERIIFVCNGDACSDHKSKKVLKRIEDELKAQDATDRVRCVSTQCMHLCGDGVNVVVAPEGRWFPNLKPKDAEDVVKNVLPQ